MSPFLPRPGSHRILPSPRALSEEREKALLPARIATPVTVTRWSAILPEGGVFPFVPRRESPRVGILPSPPSALEDR